MTRPSPAPATSDAASPHDQARGRILVGLMLSMGLTAMDSTIVATAIPSVVSDLGGFSLIAWVFSIYVLTQAISIPIYGKLADLYGRKPTLIIGTLIFLAGSMLSGISWNMAALIAFRALQGIGAGAVQPIVSTIAGDLYDVEERARIQGWLSSVWGISAVIGPAIGGFFAQYASWRWIFYINLPIGAVAIYMVTHYFHEHITRHEHRIDFLGSALLALAVGVFILGTLEGGVGWPWLSWQSGLVFVVALLALLLFVVQEARAREPMLPLWVFRRGLLVGANVATLALGILSIGITSYLPTYAQGVLRVNAVIAGFLLAAMSISWPIASALSGRLYIRFGFRDTALTGTVIALVGSGIFLTIAPDSASWLAGLGSFVMGAGLGLLSTPLLVGIQSVVGWNRRGVVTGSNMFARQLGQAVGAALLGSVLNSALLGWLASAPPAIARQLPATTNSVSQVLGGNGGAGSSALSPLAAEYVRHGLYLAMRDVFWGLVIVAVGAIIALLLTPRVFKPLRFAEDGALPGMSGSSSAPGQIAEQPQA